MKIILGDIWGQEADVICITTNGYVGKTGLAVMGRGCALEAKKKYPQIAQILGEKILRGGNVPHVLIPKTKKENKRWNIVSFPVKPCYGLPENVLPHLKNTFEVQDEIPGWAVKAELEIIENSAKELVKITDIYKWRKVILPRPGCGAGGLKWKEVRPVIDFLDDRFFIITKEKR